MISPFIKKYRELTANGGIRQFFRRAILPWKVLRNDCKLQRVDVSHPRQEIASWCRFTSCLILLMQCLSLLNQ